MVNAIFWLAWEHEKPRQWWSGLKADDKELVDMVEKGGEDSLATWLKTSGKDGISQEFITKSEERHDGEVVPQWIKF